MSRSESQIQKGITVWVKSVDWPFIKHHPGTHGCPKGFPDLEIFVPGGMPVFIEVKKDDEKPKKIQKWWFTRLTNLGYHCRVVNNVGHAKCILTRIYDEQRSRRRTSRTSGTGVGHGSGRDGDGTGGSFGNGIEGGGQEEGTQEDDSGKAG